MYGMFSDASSFNGDISGWDVSGVTNMAEMFDGAGSFEQNLGNWYIVLGDTSIEYGDATRQVTTISSQNAWIEGNQNVAYSIDGAAGDGGQFEIDGNALKLKSVPDGARDSYNLTILSSGGFGTSNSKAVTVNVTGIPTRAPDSSDFVTTWKTTAPGQSITVPARGTYTIDWGDGTVEENVRGSQSHRYDSAGNHTVRISDDITGFQLSDRAGAHRLVSIDQWGTAQWTSMYEAFMGASNMEYNAADAPDLSRVTDASYMFYMMPRSFNGDLSSWNVSSVTDMSYMFSHASSFNGDISGWDVSSVTTMRSMFSVTDVFNQDISFWNVSSVTNMRVMFSDATAFNQPLDAWDVSSVTNMRGMFYIAPAFNQPLDAWDVSSVIHMYAMFSNAYSFNQPLNSWNVSSVADMASMFNRAYSFNQPLDAWDVSSVTSMHSMFQDTDAFNQPLDSWNVSSVTDMNRMFRNADAFNQPLSSWDVSSVTNMYDMFDGAASFNGDISGWNVSSVTNMLSMFSGATSFNQPLDSWDVSSVTRMYDMFSGATSFNQPLDSWDVSSVTNMGDMFYNATSFNQPLNSWDVSSATSMSHMFEGASAFEQNLGNWHIVLDDTSIDHADTPGTVGRISAQNPFLDRQNPTYGIGTGGDSIYFGLNRSNLVMKEVPTRDSYTVTITASSTGDFGTGNSRTLTIDVSGLPNTPPSVDAGPDQTVPEGSTVTLNGNATDQDAGDTLTYLWSQDPPSPVIAFENATAVSTTFTAPKVDADTTFALTLTASDGTTSVADTTSVTVQSVSGSDFVTTWKTTAPGQSITVPARGTYTIDWGDGTIEEGVRGSQSHTYDSAGTHTVRISDSITGFQLSDRAGAHRLVSIDQWGTAQWKSMHEAFEGASNMEYNAADAPDLSRVTDASFMFHDASSFNGDLSTWDVSSVTNMYSMFSGARSFNGNLSTWDVSSVTSMQDMFYYATSFNQPLDSWDVSSVVHMGRTFSNAPSFNQPLSSWNMSSVVNMRGMFSTSPSFNQPLDSWDVSSATNMRAMFYGTTSFNQPLDSWDVSSATDMVNMFKNARSFNQPLDSWDVSSVILMHDMFRGATSFNQNISSWNVSSVTDMSRMFYGAPSFNQPLDSWDVSSVTDMFWMFYVATSFNQPLDSWDVSSVTRMYGMFSGASSFNQPLDSWDVSSVTNMGDMFYNASSFNQPLNTWDVSSATSMGDMFEGASSFEQNLGNWHIVLDDTSIDHADTPGTVGRISAQNPYLDRQNPTYGIGTGGDSNYFGLNRSNLVMKEVPTRDSYTVTITASSTGDFGTGNSRTLTIDVSGLPNIPPSVDAGPDQTVPEGSTATLNGTATDHDGDTLTYLWSQDPASPAIAFANATAASTTFAAPQVDANTTLTLTLTVNDGTDTSSDALNLTIADVPLAPDALQSSDFVTTWRTTTNSESITVPARGTYTIDWGDGTIEEGVSGSQTHRYDSAGTHTVRISDGITGFHLDGSANARKLVSIDQWGTAQWTSVHEAFRGASNMGYNAADAPDLSRVSDASHMFHGASSFNGDISSWNVSSVTNMRDMFRNADAFNQPLNSWDVSSVTNMRDMFRNADAFNQPLNSWDVSSVTNMRGMFYGASSFNQPLNSWDVSSVTTMLRMFGGASSFNGDISNWSVSSVTDMAHMFHGASSFNGDISSWDVSSVAEMRGMFHSASSFNQPLDSWDVSSVTTMYVMFLNASSFNQPLNSWDISSVTTMIGVFMGASSFNGDISSWDVSRVNDMRHMFEGATSFNQPLNSWDVSSVTTMSSMFRGATSFNQPLNSWDLSSLIYMGHMFRDATSFNQPLSSWDISSVTYVIYMFSGATSFNQPLDSWNMSSVNRMSNMFSNATSFNQPLDSWDVSSATSMAHMFYGASSFVQNLGSWHIVLDDTSIDHADTPGTVGRISAQNPALDRQNPTYGIGTGGDSIYFGLNGTDFVMREVPTKDSYTVTITATSTGDFGTDNSRTFTIDVSGLPDSLLSVNAGPDQTVPEGSTVTLNGTATGSDAGDALIYRWSHDRPALPISLADQNAVDTTFTAPDVPANTTVTFTLTATDQRNATASDTVEIAIVHRNAPPSVDAGPDQTVQEGSPVTLSGTASDGDNDALTYLWSQDPASPAIAFDNATATSTTFTAPQVDANATLTLTLTVHDGTDASSDTLNLTIADVPDVPDLAALFLCHHLANHGQQRVDNHPRRGRHRSLHGRLGGRHHLRRYNRRPDPHLRYGRNLYGRHIRGLCENPPQRGRQRRKTAVHRPVGRHRMGVDGVCVQGGVLHGVPRRRLAGPLRYHQHALHVRRRLLLQRGPLLLGRLLGDQHDRTVRGSLLLQRRHILLGRL